MDKLSVRAFLILVILTITGSVSAVEREGDLAVLEVTFSGKGVERDKEWREWVKVEEKKVTEIAARLKTSKLLMVSAGKFHTCAIGLDGILWCWGWNDHGQLRDGTNENKNTPIKVIQ